MRRVLGHIFSGPSLIFVSLETLIVTVICLITLEPSAALAGTVTKGGTATVVVALPAAIMAVMYSGGLYDRDALFNLKRAVWRAAVITLPIFGLAVLTTGVLARTSVVPIYPYRWEWTIALTGIWLLSVLLLRFAFHQIHQKGYFTRSILFIGSERHSTELDELANLPTSGFRVAATLLNQTGSGEPDLTEPLIKCAANAGAREIVVGSFNKDSHVWRNLVDCRLSGLRVVDYLDFCEAEAGRISLEAMRPEWLALSHGFRFRRGDEFARRVADVVIAVTAIVITAPVLLITAFLVKLQDGGPVLYRQERVGLHGKSFVLLKFRSMRTDAERDGPAWAAERDSRTTPFGRLIRKVRIDELPQFVNVLLGEMSLVGPRPERPCFVQQFSESIPCYDYRHFVKPGITGWAQVSFRYGVGFEDTKRKLSYDLYYVKNRGPALDLLILLKTIGVVVRGDGAR